MNNSVIVSLRDIVVEFDGQRILDGLNLDIHDKEFVTLLGSSGCGKTTLLSVLLNLLPADSGEIHGFQKPSAVFQEDRLLPYLTAAKNISVAAGCTETAAEKALFAGRVRSRGPQKERRTALRRHGKARFHRPRHADKR